MQDNEKSLLKSDNSHAADAFLRGGLGLTEASAKVFAEVANRFSSDIHVRWDGNTANGKSIIDLVQLNVPNEQVIRIITKGSDAELALTALEQAMMDGLEPDVDEQEDRAMTGFQGAKDVRRGKAAAPGLAIAVAHVWLSDEIAINRLSEGYQKERNKFLSALISARQELQKLIGEASEDASLLAALFAEQLNQLDDPTLLEATDREIRAGLSALEAFAHVVQTQEVVYELEARVLNCLAGNSAQQRLRQLPANPVILVAHSLSPSDYTLLDPERVAGIVLESDLGKSLAGKILKIRGIPCVSNIGASVDPLRSGTPLIVDGDSGLVVVKPNAEAYKSARELIRARTDKKNRNEWSKNARSSESASYFQHSVEHFAAAAKIAAEFDIPALELSPKAESDIRRVGASRGLPGDIEVDKPNFGSTDKPPRRKRRMWDFLLGRS